MSNGDATRRRHEIELAWHRAELNGLDPGMEVKETPVADIDTRSRLIIASEPVLDRVVDELSDTRFSVLLADSTSRIVDRRVGDASVARALDRVLAVPGLQYLEELSGTNSLATSFELRTPIAVTGTEHYLEALHCFSCYGAPIIHPVTQRLEGVIDLSGPVEDATGLLGPFLMRAVRDIELRLLEGARLAEKQLLAEFQAHSGRRRHAVVALSDDLVLTNPEAVDLVKGTDHVALRTIAADLSAVSEYDGVLVLDSGVEVHVHARRVAGAPGGALFDLRPTGSVGRRARSAPPTHAAPAVESGSVSETTEAFVSLVTGESGSGRSTKARSIAGDGCRVIDAADAVDTDQGWLSEVTRALAESPTVIEDVDLLDDAAARRLSALLRRPLRHPVVLTGLPMPDLSSAQTVLVSNAVNRHDLQPLRSYPHRLAAVVRTMLATLAPDSTIEFSPSALQILAAQPWPGNLRELHNVVRYAARGRTVGVIIDRDLPDSVRTSAPERRLTGMESAERDAIVAALRDCNGNKAAAAAQLGIGRTTLYDRLRRFRISVPDGPTRR